MQWGLKLSLSICLGIIWLGFILVLELSLAGIISPADYVSFPVVVAASLIPAGAQF